MSPPPPRYRQLAADLRAEILSGRLAPGAQLPTEFELCTEHGISRHTAREALRLLSEDGLIERRRGIGTVVTDVKTPTFAQSIDDFDRLLQYARDTRLTLETADIASPEVLEQMGLTGNYTVFSGYRQAADSAPVALTRMFMQTAFAPSLETARTLSGSFSEWMEETHKVVISRVTQRMEAIALTAGQAKTLSAQTGSPALRTIRRYRDEDDHILMLSESLHPAGRFAYEMRLDRTR